MSPALAAAFPAIVSLAIAAGASAAPLPPRSEWRATSSSVTQSAMAPALAIDGDDATRWGGAFSPGHWFQVDFGRTTELAGVHIHWDSGFATGYRLETSLDGRRWSLAFATTDGTGQREYVYFPAAKARYLRLASLSRTSDWGASIFEFDPIAASDAPVLTGFVNDADATRAWLPPVAPGALPAKGLILAREPRAGGSSAPTPTPTPTSTLHLRLPRPLEVAGLDVGWAAPRAGARLEARGADGRWILLAEDPSSLGASSLLAAREAQRVDALRLTVAPAADGARPAIRRLRMLSPSRVATPLTRYRVAASRAHAELFPSTLHDRQVYWTVVGVPAGRRKAVLDEWGNLEAHKGAPLVQPIWRAHEGRAAAAFDATVEHTLRHGWMPMPTAAWAPQAGLALASEAFATTLDGVPVALLRHRLTNGGARRIAGRLHLVVRPIQVSPPWQNAGLAPIRELAIDAEAPQPVVRVNGEPLLVSLTRPDARAAAPFGAHGETEITGAIASGTLPSAAAATDADGLAAGVLAYDVDLAPGTHADVVLAFPLAPPAADASVAPEHADSAVHAARIDPARFDTLAAQVERDWQARLGGVGLTLPDRSIADTMRAQAAYMLLNQTGPALQAGPRNYDRSFIRDGSATAVALLRMGMPQVARDYLRWYAMHAVHEDGLVSPILNGDGSVNRGFGSDIEYDAQGEFLWLVAEVARLDGGAASVREFEPQVRRALRFLQVLRERTLVPGYLADREAPERFRGILAPSISHEGYATPTHSYWDDFWGLKGWHDGAWLLREWGDADAAQWAGAQYAALRGSMTESIAATMRWKGTELVPAAADLGDTDPAGTSIGVDPCGQFDLLPRDALDRTFMRYHAEVLAREQPDALYAYTPYEWRNVLTFVHLDRPREAAQLFERFLTGRRPEGWRVFAEVVHSDPRRAIYLGDMPHTWIGSEFIRTVLGMALRETDAGLVLLPGTPDAWLAGEGLSTRALPTAFGPLGFAARRAGRELRVELEPGLRAGTEVEVRWPGRGAPREVLVDGHPAGGAGPGGIRLPVFRTLTARW